MERKDDEEDLLRSAALRNAQSILLARQRAEEDLVRAKEELERKSRELAHSLAMMSATLEATTDGILMADSEGRVTGFNENFVRMWQLPRAVMDSGDHRRIATVISRNFADPQSFLARIDAIYAAAPPESFDLLELADGRVFERFSRIQFVEGRHVGRVWSLRDVTAHRRAQEELRKQSERWRVTLASIGDAVITTDTQGRITYLNPVAEALTGWTSEAAALQPLETVFHIVHEKTRQPVENPATKALREGVIVGLANHTILITKDGAERPIDDSASPIRNEQGAVVGVVLVFRDITERQQLQAVVRQSERLLASVVESSNDAIITKSLDGTIQSWNAAAERLFGYPAAQAVGRHITLIIPADRADEEVQIIARLRAGERVDHFDTVRVRSDGQPIDVSLTISPMRDESGQVVGASKISRDITERKRLENELRQFAADLSEADRRKNEFLAMLAHELRNPLAPIRNALQIVKLTASREHSAAARQERGRPEAGILSAADMMERQIGQLVRLVDDLLDVSRISRGKIDLRLERVELAAIVAQAVETCRPVIDAAQHQLTVRLPARPVFLDADSVRLAQVFGNLLNNACKYSEPGGRIALDAEVVAGGQWPAVGGAREAAGPWPLTSPQVLVSVKDTGFGIPPEMLPNIFEMFTQVDRSLERTQGGLGIGLTLVQRLVEMHGGAVCAHSAGLGQGSEFVVRLPILGEEQQRPTAPPAQQPTAMTARRILVVDDNRDSATSLAMLLQLTGNETHIAHDGLEALAAAAKFHPDVVLLDLGMPKLNGYETARRIREQPWGKDMVLVALTGWGQEEDRRKSSEAGFNGHMVKPVDYADLTKLLAELLPITGERRA